MYNLRRGMRNILRSPIRTGVVGLLVGLCLALAIISLSLSQALELQVDQLAGELGTELQIRPAGRFGGIGNAESILTESVIDEVAALPQVESVERQLSVYLRPGQSTIPGTRPDQGTDLGIVFLTGIESTESLNLYGGGTASLESGRYFQPADQGVMVAIISAATAQEQGLNIGDTYEIHSGEFEVVGIFATEIMLGRMSTFVPLRTLQEFTDQPHALSQAVINADRVENVQSLVAEIRELVGDEADVVVPQEGQLSMFQSTLGNLSASNTTNLVVALTVAGATIFFASLLAVRERAREIGVLKALGVSARDLMTGFAWEGLTLAVLGCLLGIIIFGTAGQAVAGFFLESSMETPVPGFEGGRGGEEHRDRWGDWGGLGRFNPGRLLFDNLQVSLSTRIVATIFVAAAGLGTLGGLLPALLALRMKPAEVLRND